MGLQHSKAGQSPRKSSPAISQKNKPIIKDNYSSSNNNSKSSFFISNHLSTDNHFARTLPVEIIVHILCYLEVIDVHKISQVSRFFFNTCQTEMLWRQLINRDFGERLDFCPSEEMKRQRLEQWMKSPKASYINEYKTFFDINLKSPKKMIEFIKTNRSFELVLSECLKGAGEAERARSSLKIMAATWPDIPTSIESNFNFAREVYHSVVLWTPLTKKLRSLLTEPAVKGSSPKPLPKGLLAFCSLIDDNGDLVLELSLRDRSYESSVIEELENNQRLVDFLGRPSFKCIYKQQQ